MSNIVLWLILAWLVGITGLIGWLFFKFKATFISFISPIDEKTGSPLSQTASALSDMIARSIMAQAKGFLLGLQSGQNRAEKAIAADVATDNAGALLPNLLNSFPTLKRSLRRNPQLMDLAMQFLANKLGTTGNGHQPVTTANEQVKFNL